MATEKAAWDQVMIGERGIDELESAMTSALVPLLGDGVRIKITRIIRSDEAVTGLEIAAALEDEEEETAFAIG